MAVCVFKRWFLYLSGGSFCQHNTSWGIFLWAINGTHCALCVGANSGSCKDMVLFDETVTVMSTLTELKPRLVADEDSIFHIECMCRLGKGEREIYGKGNRELSVCHNWMTQRLVCMMINLPFISCNYMIIIFIK